jgi:hypothetical protein
LIELLKAIPDYGLPRAPQGERIYTAGSYGGPWDVVIWEAAYENMAEYEAWLKENEASPRLGEHYEKAMKLLERGSRTELWDMEELV